MSVEVHPTFLYESLWNLVGLLLVLFVVSKGRRFDGENTWFYFLWYGLGRSWIEGLRSDSLYLFDWTIMDQPIRVSQALSIVLVVVSAIMLFYNICIKKASPENLLVNQLAREAAEAAAAAEAAQTAGEAQAGDEPTADSEAQAAGEAETAEAASAPAEPAVQTDTTAEEPAAGQDAAAEQEEITHGDPN
jgi:phosphatidylglycerol:prolipoprotein diacylglycerol transferase